ncbi:hypothetical protein J6590_089075 [Homalodisca vitripennis]|nr:hypothetical protein J6590_089075 [Homalodisca vitripennis]
MTANFPARDFSESDLNRNVNHNQEQTVGTTNGHDRPHSDSNKGSASTNPICSRIL